MTVNKEIGKKLLADSVALAVGCAPPTVKLKVSRDEFDGCPVTVSWEAKNAKSIELNVRKREIGARPSRRGYNQYEVVAKRGKKKRAIAQRTSE